MAQWNFHLSAQSRSYEGYAEDHQIWYTCTFQMIEEEANLFSSSVGTKQSRYSTGKARIIKLDTQLTITDGL